jgi:hypothetical protein
MNVKFNYVNCNRKPYFERLFRKKIEKMGGIYGFDDVDVILKEDNDDKIVELMVRHRGKHYFVKKKNRDRMHLVTDVIRALKNQLEKNK